MIAVAATGSRRAVTGAILAGGASARLGGVAKGLLVVNGVRIVDRIAAALRPLTARLLIVSSHPDAARYLGDAEVVADDVPGAGPLPAIASALRVARTPVLVVAWDMPFVGREILEPLATSDDDFDATVWETESGIEPLCARYAPTALPLIDAAVASGARRARDIASLLRVRRLRYVSRLDERSPFTSVNTPDALAGARDSFPATDATAATAHPGR